MEVKKENKIISEVFVLRAIACLAVVLLHSVSSYLSFSEERALRVFQLFLMFGTPTFVFISELLISHSYSDIKPQGFFRKRVKFILIPYIVMGVFYAAFYLWNTGQLTIHTFLSESLNNVLGGYHGYFVIIIFQFYIFHFVFQKYIDGRYSARIILFISLIVNLGYLGLFNVIRLPESANVYLKQFWTADFKLPFLAWVFYFVVAYYCGKNFDYIKNKIRKNIGKIIFIFFLSVSLIVFNYFVLGFESIHSKRFDMIFYTLSTIGIFIYLSSKLKKIPNIIMAISRYSFGIYLLHPLFIFLVENHERIGSDNFVVYILFTFIVSTVGSITTTYLLNKIKFGAYVVGKVKTPNSIKRSIQKSA